MSLDQSSFDDPRKNAAALVDLCDQELKPHGFTNRARTTVWRRTNSKFDVLKINVIPKTRCQKWRVPIGSFSFDPGCLFPFLPRLGHRRTDVHPETGFGQVRLALRRGISQPIVKATNIWWAGDNATLFNLVLKDVLGQITEKVLPFFSRFEDPQELLRTFLEDDDAIGHAGVWEFGKIGSARRLLYTGFAALECGKWDLAISSLRACKEKTMGLPEPVGGLVQAEISPYLDEGLPCAEHKRAWSWI